VINLTGKVVLVTGVSSGLGRAIVEVFTEGGAQVVGAARRAKEGEALAAKVAADGGAFTFVGGDVADPKDWSRLVETCLEAHGRIDVLINNAAVTGEPDVSPVEDLKLETWDQVLAVNLRGAFLGCQAVLPVMKLQRDGVILNVASFNARFGLAGLAPYNASKAGLVQLSNSVATESHDFGVRSNAILLGGVQTEGGHATAIALGRLAKGDPAAQERDGAPGPAGADPRAVAEALAVLCLQEARLITGAEIAVDQAMLAGRAASLLIQGATAARLA
jgi:NAD(P)-dependent dehydrogenase (short-subunit alcohol dehydrogenase family)